MHQEQCPSKGVALPDVGSQLARRPAVQALKAAMQHEIADSFFNEPVDPEELEIPEYRDIIKARHAQQSCMDTGQPWLEHSQCLPNAADPHGLGHHLEAASACMLRA